MTPTVAQPDVTQAASLDPLVVSIDVRCPPGRAFDYFTLDIARWWPLASHSVCGEDAKDVRFEPRVGGRLVERGADGAEHVWGTVTEWLRGERLAFSWHPGRDPSTAQQVEVAFQARGGGTRVTLTHAGWEALGGRASEVRDHYRAGWALVFGERFAAQCAKG